MSRPRITWHPKCSCGWAGPSQPSAKKATDSLGAHMRSDPHDPTAAAGTSASPTWFWTYALACDCGWTYSRGIKVDCQQQAAWHRQRHA